MTHEEAARLSKSFFVSSKEFLVAAERAMAVDIEGDKFVAAQIPAVTCFAFAIELGLKAIFIFEQRKKIRGHNLHTIFGELSPASQVAIESAVPLPGYPRYRISKTFADVLTEHGKAFDQWRYSCECKEDLVADINFLRKLAQQTQSVANVLVNAA